MVNKTVTSDTADSMEARHAELLRLAERQGVKPVTNIDDLAGDFWPEDESIDDFIATVRRWRDEEDVRRPA